MVRPPLPRSAALALGALLAAGAASALDPEVPLSQYGLDVWTSDSGLPQNSVSAVLQTRDGYLWLGTQEGLVRFDGVRFRIYDTRNTPALSDDWVQSLAETPDGTLWIGTVSGLVRMRDGTFAPFREGGLDHAMISALGVDRGGALWAGSDLGATRIDGAQARNFADCSGVPGRVAAIGEDGRGGLWVGGPWGAARFEGTRFRPWTVADGFPGAAWALLPDPNGGLLVGTGGGLALVDGGNTSLLGEADGLVSPVVRALRRDRDGSLWIGTDGGLFRWRDGRFQRRTALDGLSSDRIVSLFEDREGSLWIGTVDGGLDRVKKERIAVLTARDGLSDDRTWCVLEDRRGSLWVGTADGGLHRRAPGAARFETVARFDATVVSLAEESSGAVWVGTRGAGLARIEGSRITRYTVKDGLSGNAIGSLLVDRRGIVWAGTMAAGVNRFENGRFTTLRVRDGLGSDAIFSLFEDREGAVWIGTFGGGVTRWADGRIRTFTTRDGLPHDVVMSTYQDGEGTYWFATRGGLSQYRDGRFTTYRQREGVFHDAAQRVLQDGRGFLWLTSNTGVFRVSLAELAAAGAGPGRIPDRVTFGTAARMIPAECNGTQHGAFRSRDGRLWFATIKGLAVADPAHIEWNTVAPTVVLEQVTAAGEPRPASGPLRFPPGTDRLEFGYTGLSFRNPQAVRFRFRLEGFDRDWVDAGARRTAYYTNLPPGHYRFRVIAANEDGLWSRGGAVADVVLERALWQTAWFRIAVLLALAAAAAAGYRLRVRRLETRERLRTALVEAQLDALQFQLRPHFLFNTLNSILPLIGREPDRARQMVIQLGELLRLSLRSEGAPLVPLEEELAILGTYLEIERVRFRDLLEVTLDVPPEVSGARVPSFLLQPLAENAIKHGLANTRRRLEALYPGTHELTLGDSPEGGCEVRLRIPFELVRVAVAEASAIRRAS